MQPSYIPKASSDEFCEWIHLCSIRKDEQERNKVWVKYLSWEQKMPL